MLVNGGRSGRARVVSFVAAASVFGWMSVVGFGCGSRTSMLDPDVFGAGTDSVARGGSSNVHPTPMGSAGKPASGGVLLGNGGAASGSKGGASGLDPSLALTPCQKYCPAYGAQCAKRLKGQDCMPTCQGELNGSGPTCQVLGIQALNCLTPFFSANGGPCDPAVDRALTLCSGIVNAFEDCKKGASIGPKQPTTPPPAPTPGRVDVLSCPTPAVAIGPECKILFSCANGDYETYCSRNGQNPSLTDCVCTSPNGMQTMTQLMQSANVCFDAAHVCQ